MQINMAALSRIASSNMSGAGSAQLFVMLAEAARIAPKGASLNFNLGFQQPGDTIAPGDLFPLITLSLIPASEIGTVDGTDHSTDNDAAARATGK
jgi:hypothetical protein